MGRRGPPPKPTKLRVLEGNRGKRPLNKREPQPPALRDLTSAKPPKFLTGVISRTVWNTELPLLIDLGIVASTDLNMFAAYCESVESYQTAHMRLSKQGVTMIGSRGTVIRHPDVKNRREAKAEMLRLAMEFGLTPAARSRIKTIERDAVDPFEDFLDGKR